MAADFVGLTVLVKLKNPPTVFQGLVASVQNQRLRLSNGEHLAITILLKAN